MTCCIDKSNILYYIIIVMREIKILPIFNQSAPGVWEDFLHIRAVSEKAIYNYTLDESDYNQAFAIFRLQWAEKVFDYAFGAYDDKKMVGFIQGICAQKVFYINRLYVLPEYMRMKIGTRLLNNAEKISGFVANRIDLISMQKAKKLYERNGFNPLTPGSNSYFKNIAKKANCTSLPIFKVTSSIAKACDSIAKMNGQTFNKNMVNDSHNPMYVYLDVNSEVKSFIVGDNSGNIIQACDALNQSGIGKQRLLKEYHNLINSKER